MIKKTTDMAPSAGTEEVIAVSNTVENEPAIEKRAVSVKQETQWSSSRYRMWRPDETDGIQKQHAWRTSRSRHWNVVKLVGE